MIMPPPCSQIRAPVREEAFGVKRRTRTVFPSDFGTMRSSIRTSGASGAGIACAAICARSCGSESAVGCSGGVESRNDKSCGSNGEGVLIFV